MDTLRKQWWRMPVAIRKPLVFMVGTAVVIAGVAMLVLPGPGWAAIFLGFAILGTEFAFAAKVRDWLITTVKTALRHLKSWWRHFILRRKA